MFNHTNPSKQTVPTSSRLNSTYGFEYTTSFKGRKDRSNRLAHFDMSLQIPSVSHHNLTFDPLAPIQSAARTFVTSAS